MKKIFRWIFVIGFIFTIGAYNSGCSMTLGTSAKFNVAPVAARLSFKDGDFFVSAVEVKYSFTNNSDSDMCFNECVIDNAYQDGEKLETAHTSFFIEGYSETKQNTMIRSGSTIEVITIYHLKNETSPVELELKNVNDKILYSAFFYVPEAPEEGMLFNDRWVGMDKLLIEKDGFEDGNIEEMKPFAEAIPQINKLIGSYYAAYIAGDLDTLQTYAEPISDQEKSYIALMSQFIDSYENIKCYTKPGLLEGEYAVSVVMDVHFTGTTTATPGLDFFWVYKGEDGTYRIDNRYSQFNLQNKELELDSLVEDFIEDYEAQDDVVALCNDVETRYKAALAADEKLKQLVSVTIQDTINEWRAQQDNGVGRPAADNPGIANQNNGMQSISETVYLTVNVNIRKEPSETAEKIAYGAAGQSLTRTEIMSNGWSQVSYNGGTAYIKSEHLSTVKPEKIN